MTGQLDVGPINTVAQGPRDSSARQDTHPRGRDAHAPPQPVAQVVIDTSLAHLDRPFSYLVPEAEDHDAQPGVRVRVRFAGRDHDGFVVGRSDSSSFDGALSPIRRVVSPEVVLTPHLLRVARQVADHYAGTLSDILRLAIPPRHAAAERAVAPVGTPNSEHAGDSARTSNAERDVDQVSAWASYPAGDALLGRLSAGAGPAASWLALPSQMADRDWPVAIAEAVEATRRSGRGSVVVVPDHRDQRVVSEAMDALLGPDSHVQLSTEQGPGARYTAWLSVLRGHHDIVVGTRSAAYAPVRNPGLFVLWDEMDDLHREPRSPYPHLREVLRIRASDSRAGLLLGGFVRSVEVAYALQQSTIRSVHAPSDVVHEASPHITVAGERNESSRDGGAATARLPSQAWRTIGAAVKRGPVLVQVPRRGYLMALSCARCRHRLHCARCQGPLQLTGPQASPGCAWCGTPSGEAPCPECGSTQRRSAVVGEERTAYEIGRAFPGVEVRSSRAGQVLSTVPAEPAIIVATPGAEPRADGGYAATVLMDGWALVDRAGLDAPMEALRRWAGAAALTEAKRSGGQVVIVGVPAHGGVRPVEALVRWDPDYLAQRELAERRELGLPPLRRVVSFVGDDDALKRVADRARRADPDEYETLEVLGPISRPGGGSQIVVRVRGDAQVGASNDAVVGFTRAIRAERSLSKSPDVLRAVVDPIESVL
ncbi:MAG: primosome assembly protein PriA [Ornithinimicrobium sp.]